MLDDEGGAFGTLSSSLGDILRRGEDEQPPKLGDEDFAQVKRFVRDAVHEVLGHEGSPNVQEFTSKRGSLVRNSLMREESVSIAAQAPNQIILMKALNSALSELSKDRKPRLENALRVAETAKEELYEGVRLAERELRMEFSAQKEYLAAWESLHMLILSKNIESLKTDLERVIAIETTSPIPSEAAALLSEIDSQITKPITTISLPPDGPPMEARNRKEALKKFLVLEQLLEAKDRVIWQLGRDLLSARSRVSQLERILNRSGKVSFATDAIPKNAVKEASGTLTQSLSAFDDDADGLLTRVQLAEALKAVGGRSDEQIDGIILELDETGSGEFVIKTIVEKIANLLNCLVSLKTLACQQSLKIKIQLISKFLKSTAKDSLSLFKT